MQQAEINIPDDYISGLNINGMHGRVLQMPARQRAYRNTDVLMIYGHHSSIERMYSLATHFTRYGNVTMPDIPGFGGMDSFYTIGQEPSLDAMADYVATFIKLHYKNKKFLLCGMSYGFLIATKMLQKYPEITKQVTLLLSVVGFSSKEDFSFKPRTYKLLTVSSLIGSWAPIAFITKHIILTKPVITATYTILSKSHAKMKDADINERKRRIQFEVYLWKCNDARTYFYTSLSFLTCDLTNKKVSIPLLHVTVKNDQYFNTDEVVKNFNSIYPKVTMHTAKLPNHAPTVISTEQEAAKIIPNKLKKYLNEHGKRSKV